MGGGDELANLVTLCDVCHAAHHPTLMGELARRVVERWAIRLARWLDREGIVGESVGNFGPALRLFGLERFRDGSFRSCSRRSPANPSWSSVLPVLGRRYVPLLADLMGDLPQNVR